MMRIKRNIGIFLVLGIVGLTSCSDAAKTESSTNGVYPQLILTKNSVSEIRTSIKDLPILEASFKEFKENADKAIQEGIVVPLPKDPGGGYTHEQHKRNYMAMYHAGVAFQITEDEVYAKFVEEMLLEYAKMYPTLGFHPQKKNQAPGKLFWQGLNESVWLVYSIQAYDCVYEYLSPEVRQNVETNLFRKVVEFFTIEDSYSFNRIHNHGTWAAAGVGMTGMVLKDTAYVNMALYGTQKDGNAGFLKQIDELFSPDGFYTEGPYYQRYAIMPFIVFAQALENNKPELEIFKFKNGVLPKAVSTLLQLTNANGGFFPLNDAIKEKNFLSPEVIFAADIAYSQSHSSELLSIAKRHGKVMLSKEGLEVAKALKDGKESAFKRKSQLITDGSNGSLGGVCLLRTSDDNNELEILLKATSQGMGHGHFDRLAYQMYENGEEIIQDYGAARFLNIEEKHGGRYLPENTTWAKQTIAHNTVAINGESNFSGNLKEASKFNPQILYTDFRSEEMQIAAVVDSHCYNNSILQRTMIMLRHNNSPYVVDVFRVVAEKACRLDLPVYFQGHVMSTNFNYTANTEELNTMEGQNGYQHLWELAKSENLSGTSTLTWKNGNRFYSYSYLANGSDFFLTKIGANDSEFNLRNEPGFLWRENVSGNHTFVSVLEAHGSVDPVKETVSGTKSNIKNIQKIYQDNIVTGISLEFKEGGSQKLFIAHGNNPDKTHKIQIDDINIEWKGNSFITQ